MKIDRSALVFLLGLATGALSACDDGGQSGATGDWRVCVDDHNRRVGDALCQSSPSSSSGSHFVYIPGRGGVPAIGGVASDASLRPSSAATSVLPAPEGGVARGGFGGTGEGATGAHGGGAGGE